MAPLIILVLLTASVISIRLALASRDGRERRMAKYELNGIADGLAYIYGDPYALEHMIQALVLTRTRSINWEETPFASVEDLLTKSLGGLRRYIACYRLRHISLARACRRARTQPLLPKVDDTYDERLRSAFASSFYKLQLLNGHYAEFKKMARSFLRAFSCPIFFLGYNAPTYALR